MMQTDSWGAAREFATPAFYQRWWPLLLGLAAMYVPTFYELGTGLWTTEGYAHGPLILLLALWLIGRQWPAMWAATAGQPSAASGWVWLVVGLLMYGIGRPQDILMGEIGSFIVVLAALLLLLRGRKALAFQWFPFFFLLFMIPLPSGIVGLLTMPMKLAVSYATENLLYWVGYPIARNGVMLQIGQYQLLVADACAGLQTLLTLEALGLFYLNVVTHTSGVRNVALACLIIPISFAANVIRVTALTLVTYYFGDAVGQGFLHGFAGMVLFISALILIISVDSLLQYAVNSRNQRAALAAEK